MARPTNAQRREKARQLRESSKSDNQSGSLSIKNDVSMKDKTDKKKNALSSKKSEMTEFEEIVEVKKSGEDLDVDSKEDAKSSHHIDNDKSNGGKFETPDNLDMDDDFSSENLEYKNDFNINDLTDFTSSEPVKKYDPLEEPVIKRNYTQGDLGNQVNSNSGDFKSAEPVVEPIIPEPVIKIPHSIPNEPNSSSTNTGNDSFSQSTASTQNSATANVNSPNPEQPKQKVNPDLKDLSPKQKKEAAEKAADALIEAYAKVIPIVPKKLSKFNMRKLENMEMKDEIALNMVVGSDDYGNDVTARNYCENVNVAVDKIFTITEEMKLEIREPLIEVLLENDIALTPTQRLLMAVGSQVVQMAISTIQLVNENKNALKTFVAYHNDNKREKAAEMERRKFAADQESKKTPSEREFQENKISEEDFAKKKSEANNFSNESSNTNNSKIDLEDVISTENKSDSNTSNGVTMEDVLTEANGGITVEEEHEQ